MLLRRKVKMITLLTLVITLVSATFSVSLALEKVYPKVGGGPSPSVAWTYKDDYTEEFTYSQVKKMSSEYQGVMSSSKFEAGKIAYNVSLFAAGFYGKKIGAVTAGLYGIFGANYFGEIQDAANTLATAVSNHSEGDIITLKVTEYHRPASGEEIHIYRY